MLIMSKFQQPRELTNKKVRMFSNVCEAARDVDLILIMADHSTFGNDLIPNRLPMSVSAPAAILG
jgi:hypothetical protein